MAEPKTQWWNMSDLTLFSRSVPRPISLRRGEQGFVLLTTLLIMTLLVLLGMASTSSTIMELQIAGNDREYKRNFFRAEGAALEAGQLLRNIEDSEELNPALTTQSWIQDIGATELPVNWDESAIPSNNRLGSRDELVDDIRLAVVAGGVEKNSSLNMNAPTIHTFQLYGRSRERNGQVIISIGYKQFF